jgi:hypothetical protein
MIRKTHVEMASAATATWFCERVQFSKKRTGITPDSTVAGIVRKADANRKRIPATYGVAVQSKTSGANPGACASVSRKLHDAEARQTFIFLHFESNPNRSQKRLVSLVF